MALKYDEVLKRMGWVDGFRVPIANAENQALEAELEKLMVRKAKATVTFNNADSRFKNLEKHLKYVLQESEQNQVLLANSFKQINEEENILKTKQAEKTNLHNEIRRMVKDGDDIQDRCEIKRVDLEKGLTKLEKLKMESSWDYDALNAWQEALNKRDEDNELLKTFSMEDQKKANDLEARRMNLQGEVLKRNEIVAKMAADLISYELILDRTSKTFNQMRDERTSLVNQWQNAVKMLRQRNLDIEKLHMDINSTQEVLAQQEELLEEQNEFLANEKSNNKEMQFEISDLNIMNSKLRKDRNELSQYVLTLKSEYNALHRTMVASANELEKKRKDLKTLINDIENKNDQIEKRVKELELLRKKLDEITHSSMTSDQRAKKLEQIIEAEEKNFKVLVQEHARLQILLYRNQQILYDLQEIGKTKECAIENHKTSFTLSKKELQNLYADLEIRKEIAYDIEFRINEMESKLLALEGNDKTEDQELLERRVEALTVTFNEHDEVKSLLQKEITRLDDEMRRLQLTIATDNEFLVVIKGKLQHQVLIFEGGLKTAAAAKLRSQEKQVEENVLKLTIDQYEKNIKKQDDKIYNLQRFKLDLYCAMKEKQVEAQSNLEVLKVKKRNLEEELHRLKCDIMNRNIRIEQFQKKHHIAVMSLGRDEDGKPLSITHIKIKNAQEKYLLVTEGDELDNKIKRTEGEIMAMENTLKVINITNSNYKKSLAPVTENDEETVEMKRLEKLLCETTTSIRSNRRLITNIQNNIKEIKNALKEAQRNRNEVHNNLEDHKECLEKIKREDHERNEKLIRAERQLKTISKRISACDLQKYQRDLMIRQLQDANNSALQQLTEISLKNADLQNVVVKKVAEHGLFLPGAKSKTSITSLSDTSASFRSTTSDDSSSSNSGLAHITLTLDTCDVKKGTCSRKKKS